MDVPSVMEQATNISKSKPTQVEKAPLSTFEDLLNQMPQKKRLTVEEKLARITPKNEIPDDVVYGVREDIFLKYDVIKQLRFDDTANVFKAQSKLSGATVALKVVNKEKIMKNFILRRSLKHEIDVLSCLNHPQIVGIHEVFEDDEKVYLVMDFVEGCNLEQFLFEKRQGEKLSEEEAKDIYRQLVSITAYLHSKKIHHRDIKLLNIMIGENNRLTLLDFGLSHYNPGNMLGRFVAGSPRYIAPEQIGNKAMYEQVPVDVYMTGVCLFTLLCGRFPFQSEDNKELRNQIKEFEFEIPEHVSPAARDLLFQVMNYNPDKRPSFVKVLEHEWLNN